MTQPAWRIGLFGRLSAQRGESRITHFKTEKTGLLLACLASAPSRQFRREELIEQLWPDEELESGRNNLRVAAAFLRKVLEPDERERGALLAADRNVMYLRREAFVTDSAQFERSLLEAYQSNNDAGRADRLQAAVDLYSAEFLSDYDALWISSERLRLADAYHVALRRLALAHVEQSRYDLALEAAQRSIRDDPLREETHRLIMQILARMGRPHAALRQYRELESLLKAQAGAGPSKSTRGVLTEVCRVTGITQIDEGPLPHHAVAVVQAPSAASKPVHYRLPAPLTSLFGRDDSVVQIAEMLDNPNVRLITLTGLGGIGKTRLAIRVAHRLRKEGKTVCYVPLGKISDNSLLVSNLAVALQIDSADPESAWDRTVDVLSRGPFVLVLDNIEHLLPHAAVVVRDLLESAPELRCVLTSRQRICIGGEHEHNVQPLRIPDISDGLTELSRCPSARMWLDRVHARRPDYEILPEALRDVIDLFRRLDGIPLAIELAAACADMITPREIVRLLDARIDLPASRDVSADPRHASLTATLDWSVERLPLDVQRFFACLGLFQDGWTVEAARDVCDARYVLDCLATLCERSLITADSCGCSIRYRMLPTVREYALARLTGVDLQAARQRFVAHYTAIAEHSEPALKGPDTADCIDRLQREEENCRCAIRHAVTGDPDSGAALRLCLALYRYWYIRGSVREGRRWLTVALGRAGGSTPNRLRALMALGNLAYAEGDLAAAEGYYTECRSLHAAAGDVRGVAAAIGNLVNIRQRLRDLPTARALAIQSLRIFQKLDDARGQAISLANLALVTSEMGDCPQAMECGEQAIAKFRALSDDHNLLVGLPNLSRTAIQLGKLDRAVDLLREALDLCTRLGSDSNLAHVLSGIADIALAKNRRDVCVRLRGAAAGVRERLNIVRPPNVQEAIDAEMDLARRELGEPQFDQEWRAGFELSYETAAALADSSLKSL